MNVTRRVMHFKPMSMSELGALCGKRDVDFTGRLELVKCKSCIARARAGAK